MYTSDKTGFDNMEAITLNIIKGRTFTFDEMRGIDQRYMKPKWQELERTIIGEIK